MNLVSQLVDWFCLSDAFVECKCCGPGVVEVKCPFCTKFSSVESAAESSTFCLSQSDDGILNLKHEHMYYMPVATLCPKRLYCYFVIWTEVDLHIERLTSNEDLLHDKIPIVKNFFNLCVLPELYEKWFTRKHSIEVPCGVLDDEPEHDIGTWCYCKETKGGQMICCETNVVIPRGTI